MNKNAIKKYAVWARRELISRVRQRAALYEIAEDGYTDAAADSVLGRVMSVTEKQQRQALIARIQKNGYEQVMEEAAYTWFNRFSALRFMEVNGYLPSHVRIFTDDTGAFRPQILTEAINLELDGLDMKKVYALKGANDNETLFKYLIIVQCNALSKILPGMFQKIDDYTELLFPDNLLREGSAVEQMITMIPEEDWRDQVQIIGWLYQYYNTEQNELVYDGSMSKSRIPKELLPAATTIYTPDWSIRYMVENSLGRLWVEGHPNDDLKANWKYYLEEAEQEPEVQARLAEIRKEYAVLNPEDLLCVDPCMGSGHILCYFFDVLMQIYESQGYSERDAAQSILEHNIWGLDIDDRAYQLAYFAVMMKARQYDRRILTRGIQPHVYAIVESNGFNKAQLKYFGAMLDDFARNNALNQVNGLLEQLYNAKEYGSILTVDWMDWALLREFAEHIAAPGQLDLDSIGVEDTQARLKKLIDVGEVLAQKYSVTCTNPPYMGSSRFSPDLDQYVKEHYPTEKSDLSIVMYKRALTGFAAPAGFVAFITTSSWMFLSSFEKLRTYLFANMSINSLVDYGTELFEGKVGHNPIVSWVTRNTHMDYAMTAIRLVDYCYSRRDEKEPEFFEQHNHYTAQQDNFSKIPGSPVAYWVSRTMLDAFENANIGTISMPRQGLITGDNDRFLRLWQEISNTKFSIFSSVAKWFPINKGGEARRWYGNQDYIINWSDNGLEIRNFKDNKGKLRSRPQNLEYNFHEAISWSLVTSGIFTVRYYPDTFMFNVAGISCFPDADKIYYLLALLNTKVSLNITQILNPTINMNAGDVAKIPILFCTEVDKVSGISRGNMYISKLDWDSFETSWDFKRHPLV